MSHNWNVGDLTIGHKDMLTNQEEIMWRVLLHTLSRRVLHIRKRKVFSRRLSRTMKSWQSPRNCFTSSLDARVSWSEASSRSNVRVRWTKFWTTWDKSGSNGGWIGCYIQTPHLYGTSYLIPRTSYLVPHSSYRVPRTSYLVPRTACLVPRTLYLYLSFKVQVCNNYSRISILACDLQTTI